MSTAPDLAGLLERAVTGTADDGGAEDRTRTRILDAALEEGASVGVGRMTMEDVVRRSGLGRMTVYRRFSRRDELVEALVVREVQRFLHTVAEGLAAGETPEDRVAAAFVASMRFVRSHPLLRRVATTEPGSVLETAAAQDRLVLRMGTDFIAAQLRRARPDDDDRALHRTADLVARLYLTFLAMPPEDPDPRDDTALDAYAREVLMPLLLV
ncbi:MAG: TetR/AcrR family transcriptional regulator [Solirubrobacteraceae bacterium]|nr:TetR/AcrR family transcriptional regulator [Solirubrobacteraceae bacterium]